MGFCTHRHKTFSWVYSVLGICRELMWNVLAHSNYAAWAARVFRFSCVKCGPHSAGLHGNSNRKKKWYGHLWLTLPTGFFMQSSVETGAPNMFPTLTFLYCRVMFVLSFLLQLLINYVMPSDTQSMHLWAFQLIKTENQSVTPGGLPPVWSKKDTHDKLPLW